MMREVMGISNATTLNAHIFESDFTDWTVGQCLACVEEVRIVKAHNKYEVINRIKPNITNDIIEVHPKGKPIFNAKNTTSYLLFSNHKDALPLDDDGRRYLVLFSRWQQKFTLRQFKIDHPSYYRDLYATFAESAGAIRHWLLNHEQSNEFEPKGYAPQTSARNFMVKQSKPEFIQDLEAIIEEDETVCASDDLVDVTALHQVFMDRGFDWPSAKAMGPMFSRYKWDEVGQVRLENGIRGRFWTRHPAIFRSQIDDEWAFDLDPIRDYRRNRIKKIEVNDDDDFDISHPRAVFSFFRAATFPRWLSRESPCFPEI